MSTCHEFIMATEDFLRLHKLRMTLRSTMVQKHPLCRKKITTIKAQTLVFFINYLGAPYNYFMTPFGPNPHIWEHRFKK